MRTTCTLELNLKQLKLQSFIENYQGQAKQALENQYSYAAYLSVLTEFEIIRRTNAIIKSRLQEAKFPITKTLDTFDFTQTNIDKEAIFQLVDGNFTHSAKNIIFFGSCGTGKTHLAIAIGRQLCLKKYKVYFNNICNFINLLQEANQNLMLNKFFKKLEKYDLIILDELGYVPFEKQATDLLFQFFAQQYERRSLMITTNLAFSQWDQIFKDKQTTVAAIDRLVHHSYVFQFNSESYRLKESKKEKNK